MDLTLPLYRQFSGRYFLLILCFLLSCTIGVGFYFYQSQQLFLLNNQQIPAYSQANQRQAVLINNERLIHAVIESAEATEFTRYYKELNDNLKQLSLLSRNNRRLLEQLSQQLQKQAENVVRLHDNDRRNIQLKDSVIIQLTLVTDSLSALISAQSQQQNLLHQQLTSDRLTDRVTAVRAKALSELAIVLNGNRELYRLLFDNLVMFSRLDLQYDLTEFDYLQERANSELQQWLINTGKNLNKSEAEKALEAQILVLNELLFIEQNTFAKWRGQLRRMLDYRSELLALKAELQVISAKTSTIVAPKPSQLNALIKKWFTKINITLTDSDYVWLVIAIFSFLILLFFFVVISMRNKLKRIGQQSTLAVTKFVEKGEVLDALPCHETAQILATIEQLSRPKYSEADYLNLAQKQQLQTAFMVQHSGHAYWQLPQLEPLKIKPLLSLLNIKSTKQHWRHLFSRTDIGVIISAARRAKTKQSMQKLMLVTVQEKAVMLTIEYHNKIWRGSVCLAEELQNIQIENSQLQQQLQQQNQVDKLNIINSSDHVARTIQNVILQKQLLSVDAQHREYVTDKSLVQLLNWCDHQKTRALLRRDDYLLTLSSVNIINDIHCAVMNIALAEVENNNALYVNVDNNLNPNITIESEFFQAMIRSLCSVLLTKQSDTSLDISFKLVDVSSAQQIVRCCFTVSKPSCADELARTINDLVQDREESVQGPQYTIDYLHDLMLMFNVSNKENIILDEVAKFTFDIPLVVAELANEEQVNTTLAQKKIQQHVAKLAKRRILVIATDKTNRERISQAFSDSKVVIETMQDLTLFQRQLSIKHLTRNKLDAIIMSPEVYCSDFDLIVQYLSTLPSKLKPKVMVLQPFYTANITRTGIFSLCNLPWYEQELKNNLVQLLDSQNQQNLLVDRAIIAQYQFSATQVNVLLAVAIPSEHQLLMQILLWLGLRVTLVTQSQQAEQYWQTGQYLVLISEFTTLRLEITDQISCTRAVFALANDEKAASEFLASVPSTKSWKKAQMPAALDIDTIIQLLSTWLKPVSAQDSAPANTTTEKPINAKLDVEPTLKLVTPTVNDSAMKNARQESESVKVSQAALNQMSDTSAAFDLTAYARNQGSAELAAYMLDDYLMDIEQQLLELEQHIADDNISLVSSCLQHLAHRADVIAAQPLLMSCQACKEILANVDSGIELSSQQREQLHQGIVQLKLSFAQLSEFAESI